MRTVIGLVATVATVFHLAFGCCLHAAHFGGTTCCCVGERPDGHADDCCDDHVHARPNGQAATDAAASGRAETKCLCADCTCTAIGIVREMPHDLARPAAVTWRGSAGEATGTAGVAPGSPTVHRCPIPTDPRSALFERLLA